MTEVLKNYQSGSTEYHEKLIYFSEDIHNIRNFKVIANGNKNTVRYIRVRNYGYRTPYLWTSLPEIITIRKHQNLI